MKVLDIPISEICKIFDNGYIYLWGAGAALGPYMDELAKYQNLKKVKAIVDTYAKGERTILNRVWPIIGIDVFLEQITTNDLLIITTKFYEEIIELLKEKDIENKIKSCVYIYTLKSELDKKRDMVNVPQSIRSANQMLIPKTIHYCWFGNTPLPKQYKEWMLTWKEKCPDYEIIQWNESNYDVTKIPYMKKAYEARKWAFVSDYARLDIIYKYGGIYLDTDVEILKNIDELLYNKAFCGFEDINHIAFGLGFGAQPHFNIIKEIMRVYEQKTFIDTDGQMDLTPCPVIQTSVLKKHGLEQNGQYQVVEGMAVLPEVMLCPLSPYTFRMAPNSSNAYMLHHFSATWNPEFVERKEKIINMYTNRFEK